jgi:hypothetical protein
LKYLRTVAYPMIKEICEFWEDHLKVREDGVMYDQRHCVFQGGRDRRRAVPGVVPGHHVRERPGPVAASEC